VVRHGAAAPWPGRNRAAPFLQVNQVEGTTAPFDT